ncbi:hypothetical protein ACB092_03G242900 [Castanea dentata]
MNRCALFIRAKQKKQYFIPGRSKIIKIVPLSLSVPPTSLSQSLRPTPPPASTSPAKVDPSPKLPASTSLTQAPSCLHPVLHLNAHQTPIKPICLRPTSLPPQTHADTASSTTSPPHTSTITKKKKKISNLSNTIHTPPPPPTHKNP